MSIILNDESLDEAEAGTLLAAVSDYLQRSLAQLSDTLGEADYRAELSRAQRLRQLLVAHRANCDQRQAFANRQLGFPIRP